MIVPVQGVRGMQEVVPGLMLMLSHFLFVSRSFLYC